MLMTLRRFYLFAVTSIAFLFTFGVFTYFLYTLLHYLGLDQGQGSDRSALTQALTFVIVAIIVVVPVGGLHWWLLRRDESAPRQEAPDAGAVVRTVFLDLLLTLSSLTATFSLAACVYIALDTNQSRFFALPLSFFLSWILATLVIVLEKRRVPVTIQPALTVSMLLGYIPQFVLVLFAAAQMVTFVQITLQQIFAPFPRCGFAEYCSSYTPSPLENLGMAAVAVAGLALLANWTRNDRHTGTRRLFDVAMMLAGVFYAITGIYNLGYLVLGALLKVPSILWPQSAVYSSYYNSCDYTTKYVGDCTYVQSLPFAGYLLVAAIILTWYLVRLWRTSLPDNLQAERISRQFALIAIAIPLAAVFLTGGGSVLGNVIRMTSPSQPSVTDHIQGVSLLISGVAWVALWPILARMSDPRGNGPTVPRRLYVFVLLGGTIVASAIGLAITLYLTLSGVLGTPADKDGRVWPYLLGIALVSGVAAAYYIFVLRRDTALLRVHRQVEEGTPPAERTLEAILQDVAAGRATVPQAASELRSRYPIA